MAMADRPMDPQPVLTVQDSRPNWWSRNWRWLVPVGCIAGFMAFLAFCAGLAAICFFGITGMIKSSDAYQEAFARAKSSPAVAQELGSPINEGFFTTGNINVSNDSGNARLSIPISGPTGAGTIEVVAEKVAGKWTFSTLKVEIPSKGKSVDLLP
ncbi:MAG: cytochrome c oxidase assembly factor 1 family protein [Planctomycetia bacterium]|nr:cytochrome c oxidase assembly factor 1 family protein [Planctomycetia bacterium]